MFASCFYVLFKIRFVSKAPIRIYVYTYMCIYTYVCVCVCVCVCVFVNIEEPVLLRPSAEVCGKVPGLGFRV